ncbi:MAG: colanic acid/amylovoran biosynthesis glycosyltransferase [Akkermansiaceae bacterium]|jgi:colanic acid/amylovoran biosynthesis glycosyltransferase
MSSLLVISSAPATFVDGQPFLDKKFVEGMTAYADLWDGPVNCLLNIRVNTFPFGQLYDTNNLPFTVGFVNDGEKIAAKHLSNHDIVLCSGDSHEYLHLPEVCKANGHKLVFTIEYIIETRRQILSLDRARSLPRKAYALAWMLNQEGRRRRAFRLADGVQANGYPAFNAYNPMNPNALLYLDNRVASGMFATPDEMNVREQKLQKGDRLRLLHSGRLEPMKGSQDIIPIARRLATKGIDFEISVFGTGSLEPEIRDGIARYNLRDQVKLCGVVDFQTELVPFARAHSDIFLSCHRQADPSCTYVESMGCGLAVIGYDNRMWAALCQESETGWTAPLGNADALADQIIVADADRTQVARYCQNARAFAENHSFDREFKKRIDHLRATLAA